MADDAALDVEPSQPLRETYTVPSRPKGSRGWRRGLTLIDKGGSIVVDKVLAESHWDKELVKVGDVLDSIGGVRPENLAGALKILNKKSRVTGEEDVSGKLVFNRGPEGYKRQEDRVREERAEMMSNDGAPQQTVSVPTDCTWGVTWVDDGDNHLFVNNVSANFPGEKAGLQVGDVLYTINGGRPESPLKALRAITLANKNVDEKEVTLVVKRKQGSLSEAVRDDRLEGDGLPSMLCVTWNIGDKFRQKFGDLCDQLTDVINHKNPDLIIVGLQECEGNISAEDFDGPLGGPLKDYEVSGFEREGPRGFGKFSLAIVIFVNKGNNVQVLGAPTFKRESLDVASSREKRKHWTKGYYICDLAVQTSKIPRLNLRFVSLHLPFIGAGKAGISVLKATLEEVFIECLTRRATGKLGKRSENSDPIIFMGDYNSRILLTDTDEGKDSKKGNCGILDPVYGKLVDLEADDIKEGWRQDGHKKFTVFLKPDLVKDRSPEEDNRGVFDSRVKDEVRLKEAAATKWSEQTTLPYDVRRNNELVRVTFSKISQGSWIEYIEYIPRTLLMKRSGDTGYMDIDIDYCDLFERVKNKITEGKRNQQVNSVEGTGVGYPSVPGDGNGPMAVKAEEISETKFLEMTTYQKWRKYSHARKWDMKTISDAEINAFLQAHDFFGQAFRNIFERKSTKWKALDERLKRDNSHGVKSTDFVQPHKIGPRVTYKFNTTRDYQLISGDDGKGRIMGEPDKILWYSPTLPPPKMVSWNVYPVKCNDHCPVVAWIEGSQGATKQVAATPVGDVGDGGDVGDVGDGGDGGSPPVPEIVVPETGVEPEPHPEWVRAQEPGAQIDSDPQSAQQSARGGPSPVFRRGGEQSGKVGGPLSGLTGLTGRTEGVDHIIGDIETTLNDAIKYTGDVRSAFSQMNGQPKRGGGKTRRTRAKRSKPRRKIRRKTRGKTRSKSRRKTRRKTRSKPKRKTNRRWHSRFNQFVYM